jgi:phenylalanyl-tRNA synthetase beta chain
MLISPTWLREFVEIPVDDRRLADDLTLAGISIEGVFGEGERTVYDADITTNRVDAMNHYGVARECAAIYDKDLKPLQPLGEAGRRDAGGTAGGTPALQFTIEIEDAQGCARYTARILRGVKIVPSPAEIAARLESLEQRPINNVADATNYTLQEIGHPTHAFDLDLLEGGKIIVRRARQGEMLKTLDGVERKLSQEDLVIADARKAVALAGVMGGFDTMITEKTRNVLIESAWFDPVTIRKTARRHGMHTDASHRFERGADFNATPVACARVAELILETAGGKLEGGEIDAVARRVERPLIPLSRREVHRILGADVPDEEIARILRRLGFGISADFRVQVPTWRLDVEREIDVIEEVARIYGFDRFPNTLPAFAGGVVELPHERKDAKLRASLLALGYNEAISLSFVSHQHAAEFSSALAVEIANPLSEEAAVMRTSMLPGMLEMLAWNLNRGVSDVRLFEAGNIYEKAGERAEERGRIALGATGAAAPARVHQAARPYAFFDMKGDLEALLAMFEHRALYFDTNAAEHFHPGRAARAVMDGATVAQFGQIHPSVAQARKLRQEVYVAELYLDRLYQHALRELKYTPIPRFPAVARDFSLIFDDAVVFEQIRGAVARLGIAELRGFAPVEIFRGGAIPAGQYSVLLRATFQAADRTLRDEEVAVWARQIIKGFEGLGGTQRA